MLAPPPPKLLGGGAGPPAPPPLPTPMLVKRLPYMGSRGGFLYSHSAFYTEEIANENSRFVFNAKLWIESAQDPKYRNQG